MALPLRTLVRMGDVADRMRDGDLLLFRRVITISYAQMLNPHAGEMYRLRVTRVGTHSADTAGGDAEMVSLELREA